MGKLTGQVAIISGGLGDIGRAIALELADQGADIAIGDVQDPGKSKAFVQTLQEKGRRSRYDRIDVIDASGVKAWVAAVEADLGTPALIIPNAAIVTVANVREVTPEQWSRELRVNLDGVFHLAQAGVLRLLDKRLKGRVVMVGSWAAHAPHVHIPAYCVAKAGVRMLCQCMALELAPMGILVNEVAPGYVDAGLSGRMFDQDPDSRRKARERVPVRELIKSEEVAHQVAHLCDPQNLHMTGSTILMDGGLTLARG